MHDAVPKGLKVHVTHYRLSDRDDVDELRKVSPVERASYIWRFAVPVWFMRKHGETPDPRGGQTVVLLKDAEDRTLARGVAICSPFDNYNKAVGRMIATGRAVKQLRRNVKQLVDAATPAAAANRAING